MGIGRIAGTYKHSEKTKKKIGDANRGHIIPDWQKELLRKINTGKIVLESTKEKMRMRRGIKAANWQGGIDSSRTEKSREEYKEWRTKVFERDEYKCVLCKNGGYLEADHYPIPWKVASEKEKYDVSNGRTLCRPCHMKTFKETRSIIKRIIKKN